MGKETRAPSLVWRACLALLLVIAFYTFAVALALLLFAIPAVIYDKTERINAHLLVGCWLSAFWIVISIIPRRERFVAPGPLLREAECPALFRTLQEVARTTQQAMPKEVYLLLELNAFVSQRGGFMGLFGRRIMGVGLPLLEVMSIPEFKAVLAHEFGHYRRGDTALGPWIYTTRASIIRTVENMSNDLLRYLFVGFGKLFLRITHAVSRREEFAADAVAAHAFGPAVFAASLNKLAEHEFSFSYYLHSEWSPVLTAKRVAPLIEGYRELLASPDSAAFLKRLQAERAATEVKPDPYDTHPTTEQRLAALAALSGALAAADPGGASEKRAITLLPDQRAAERELFDAVLVQPKDGLPRKVIAWDQVLEEVYLPLWREKLKRYHACLEKVQVEEVPGLCRDRPRLQALFSECLPGTPESEWTAEVRNVLGAALAVFLSARGFRGTAKVGEVITYTCGGTPVYPFHLMDLDHAKCLDPIGWETFCEEAALKGLPLGNAGAAEAARDP